MKQAYSIPEVAALVGITPEVTRALVTLVFGETRDVLSLADLVLVREAHGLSQRKVSKSRIAQTLAKVRAELPGEQPLSAVTLQREGQEIVVGHGSRRIATRCTPSLSRGAISASACSARSPPVRLSAMMPT